MENSPSSTNDRFVTQKVGSAIKTEKSKDNVFFRAMLNKEDLIKCNSYTYTNKETDKSTEYFNISLKILKDPSNSATHIMVDSLYHKSNIEDKFAEVNLRINKEKVLACTPNDNGLIPITAALIIKGSEKSFTTSDFRVYLTQPTGEKVPADAYIGYGDYINHERSQNRSRTSNIDRDFMGTAFVESNEKLPHGQVLNASLNADKVLIGIQESGKNVFVNFIAKKNNPEQLAAYFSKDKNDTAAQFTFKLDSKELKELVNSREKEPYVKISGYFDDSIENKNYNIKVVAYSTKKQREEGFVPREIGLGADKAHIMKWQKNTSLSKEEDKQNEEKSSSRVPTPEVIKKGIDKSNNKGIEK